MTDGAAGGTGARRGRAGRDRRPAGRGRRRAGPGLSRADARAAAGAHGLRTGRPVRSRATRAHGGARRWPRSTRMAPDPDRLAAATGFDADPVADAWPLVLAKLTNEPIEDLRVDFEDGYGNRPDAEEDAAARDGGCGDHRRPAARRLAAPRRSAVQVPRAGDSSARAANARARGRRAGCRPAGCPMASRSRSRRSPRSTRSRRWSTCASGSSRRTASQPGRLRFEVQVETAQAVLGADGTATVARMIHNSRRPMRRPALRHVRLHRRARDRRQPAAARPPVGRPREVSAPARRRRHRSAGLGRLVERAAGRRPGRRACGVGAARAARPALARARVLPGLGPPPRPAADTLPRHVRVLPGRSARRAPPAGGLRRRGARPGCWTSRRRRRRWPRSCSGRSTAVRPPLRTSQLGAVWTGSGWNT